MQKILAALSAALAFVLGHKDNINALKKQVADRDAIIKERDAEIERLLVIIEDDKTDDAALEAAAVESREKQEAAEQRTKVLEDERKAFDEQLVLAETEAQKLADSISADTDIPMTVEGSNVTIGAIPANPTWGNSPA